jgi:hypothetical protein
MAETVEAAMLDAYGRDIDNLRAALNRAFSPTAIPTHIYARQWRSQQFRKIRFDTLAAKIGT